MEERKRNGDLGESLPWKMRVLIVEDDPLAAGALAELLRSAEHEVEVAWDGSAALQAVQDCPPDVILLDIGLPGIDGWEVARRVQKQPADKRPLLVAITGRGSEEDRLFSEQAGIDLHLTKPVDPEELARLLSRFRSIIAQE